MNHDRTVVFAVCAGVFQLKPLRHLHVQLDGTALPGPAKAVLQMEVNLRAIESAVALVNHIFFVQLLQGSNQAVGGDFPIFVASDVIFRHGGQFHMVFKAKHRINVVNELCYTDNLILNLLFGHKDMSIVLSKAAYPHQAVQRAGQLMPVYEAQFPHPQRQVTVGMRFRLIDQHASGAVHGL